MHNSTVALSGEVETGFGARSVKGGEPTADAFPAFRWWTFAVLIFYTASLLGFCGFVTLQKYPPADVLQGRSVASNPPHLSMLPFKVAHVEQDGTPLRMVCYQVSD
jgi:hypothetical protein